MICFEAFSYIFKIYSSCTVLIKPFHCPCWLLFLHSSLSFCVTRIFRKTLFSIRTHFLWPIHYIIFFNAVMLILNCRNPLQAWFRFKNQPSVVNPSGTICAPWLTVSPSHYLIPIQQSTQVFLNLWDKFQEAFQFQNHCGKIQFSWIFPTYQNWIYSYYFLFTIC